MKKAILILCLSMAIIASIVSGTLAVYNKTLDPLEVNVGARAFYIGSTASANIDTSIAPSEKAYHEFYVTNTKNSLTTEVDMDLTIVVDITDAIDSTAIQNLKVSLEYLNTDKKNPSKPGKWESVEGAQVIQGTGKIDITIPKAFLADIAGNLSYRLNLYWPPNDDKKDSEDGWGTNAEELLTAKSSIKITITGTQSI